MELECHIKLAHNEKEPFQCTDCEASYSSQKELNEHQEKKMKFDIWCSICTDSHKTLESFTSCVSSKNKIDNKKKNQQTYFINPFECCPDCLPLSSRERDPMVEKEGFSTSMGGLY